MSSEEPEFTVTFEPIPETLESPYTDLFPGLDGDGLVRTVPGGFVYHPEHGRNAERIFRIKPRSDDVWLRSSPRSGTTWVSEMLWLLVNDCNFEEAAKLPLAFRSPNTDTPFMSNWDKMPLPRKIIEENVITPEKIEEMPSPRSFKTHQSCLTLHPTLLETCKNVYVVRNPKDVIVSFYHFHRLVKSLNFQGDIEQFARYFMDDKIMFLPYFPHVLEAWSQRDHPNMLFLFYEDLKKDLRGGIEKVAKFLGKELTDEQLTKLTEHLRFENFEKNEAVNMEDIKKDGVAMRADSEEKFVRKGKTGDWKNYFGAELNSEIDAWIAKNTEGTGLSFVTELEDQ